MGWSGLHLVIIWYISPSNMLWAPYHALSCLYPSQSLPWRRNVCPRRHEFADCSRQPSSSGNPCEIGARTLSKCVPHDVILDRKQHQRRGSFACGGPFHRLRADLQTNTHTRRPYFTGTLVSHLRAEADIDSLANGRGLTSNKDRRSNVMDRCYRPW